MLFHSGKIFLFIFEGFYNQPETAWGKVFKEKVKIKIVKNRFSIS